MVYPFLSVWYTCVLQLLNVRYKCVTLSMNALWIRYVMRTVKVQDLRFVQKWILRPWPCWIWHRCVGWSINTNTSFYSHEDGGRFLQNIGNHLHMSPSEDCIVIVSKDYSLVEYGILWLVRWLLDYMHWKIGSHLHAGLHCVTSRKTNVRILTFWCRNYFFNFSTLCI